MSSKEDRLWERVRKWMTDDISPDVILVFGLHRENGDWKVRWKASHWIEDEVGSLPEGVAVAVSSEMAKHKMGDRAFELTREVVARAPQIIGTIGSIVSQRRDRNGR